MHDKVKGTNPTDKKKQFLLGNDGAAAVEDQLLLVVFSFSNLNRLGKRERAREKKMNYL